MKRWESVAAILAGRWQIPLAICAIIVGGVALYRMKPTKQSIPFDALLADILTLAERGEYHHAADAAANLLEYDPPPPRAQRARLHDALADVVYRQELIRGIPNRANTRLLLEHHEAAMVCGAQPDGDAALRAGRAHEWLGEAEPAISAYRTVLSKESAGDARRGALQALVRLLEGQPAAKEERQRYIQALLDEEGVAPGYLWWVLRHAVQEALEHDDAERARELLTRQGLRFKRSDLKGYHDYLWAWVHLHEERTELAVPLLDRVDQWLAQDRPADAQLDQAGFLPAMNRWLRGRVELAEERPQAALACFDDALALQSHGNFLAVVTEGRAEALGMLRRHEAACDAIRAAITRLQGDAAELSVARPRLRQTVMRLLRERRKDQDCENALAYLKLGLELTPEADPRMRLELLEQIGREYAEAAEMTTDVERKRTWHAAAANAYEQAGELAQLDEPRYAALLWESADQFDQAGRTRDARRMLTRFAAGRSLDPRMPQALLRLGQAYAADGHLTEAIEHYRQLIGSFPRLEESLRARLLSANCLVALGGEHYAEAQSIFESLLEGEQVAPQAQVFREALFGLCDLLYQRQEHAAAISRMEDFLVFYAQDPERYRVRFMLADAYRGSAHALLADETAGPEAARRQVSRERFQRAAELFEAFANEVGDMPEQTWAPGVYERLALFYRGDCLVELNDPSTLAEALAIYRQAAARYQGEPAALAAQVQIANIHLRQGKLIEAARAVERARWLLGSIPEGAFAEYDDGMDRVAWDRYLAVVRSSHLFRDVFAETP